MIGCMVLQIWELQITKKKMMNTIAKAIITTFSKIINLFSSRKNKDTIPSTSYKLMKEELKDEEQCAAAVEEKAAHFTELIKEKSQDAEIGERKQTTVEEFGGDECIEVSSSQSVAEAHSPGQTLKTTKNTPPCKLKKNRKFIPKPSPQQILNKKLLEKRRWLF